MELTEFFTLEFITSPVGATMMVVMIVQGIKELPFIKNIPTKYVAFIVSLSHMFLSNYFKDCGLTPQSAYMLLINSILLTYGSTVGFNVGKNNMFIDPKNLSKIEKDNDKE